MKPALLALALTIAASIVASTLPAKAGSSCQTTCYGSGSYRTCNTFCN